jgi:hypothetical protein
VLFKKRKLQFQNVSHEEPNKYVSEFEFGYGATVNIKLYRKVKVVQESDEFREPSGI